MSAAVRIRFLGLTAAVFGLACNERLASNDEVPLEPLCMYAAGTMGYRLDGTQSVVLVADDSGTPYACVCVTEEQFWDEAEMDRLAERLNDLVLVQCELAAEAHEFDWNDCQHDHDLDQWGPFPFLGVGTLDTPFSCDGEGWIPETDDGPPVCELGTPGCSCTVEATCAGGATCIDGMCQGP